MAEVDKDIERLIVRGLDHALTEDEELRLNRELIRNPDARQLMERCRRIDELAAAALHDALRRDAAPVDPELLPARRPSVTAGPNRRMWWLVSGAMAAGLLALVMARLPVAPTVRPMVADRGDAPNRAAPVVGPSVSDEAYSTDGYMRNARMGPQAPRFRRDTGRDVIGVIGEDGTIYWIEVDRIQTIRWPGRGASAGHDPNEM